jgi:hypothetical protein
MERDERGRAADGQADSTPPAVGFTPTRDVMRQIVHAASYVRAILDEWQRHSGLPCYPQDEGVGLALDALFRLERAVNPRRAPWRARQRARVNTRVWPRRVGVGLRWSRDLTADILERHNLRWMADATLEDFQARLSDPSSVPETISVEGDELRALDAILELLPDLDSLPEAPEHPVKAPATAPTPAPEPEGAAPEWIRCSKAELNIALEASPSHKSRITEWADSGALEFRPARAPIGRWHYEARFAKAEDARRAREAISAYRFRQRPDRLTSPPVTPTDQVISRRDE